MNVFGLLFTSEESVKVKKRQNFVPLIQTNLKNEPMETETPSKKRNYGKMGCFVALLIFAIIIILIATGVINYSWEF